MASKRNMYAGVYENMDFATYEFREYPKHVPINDRGAFEIANTAEEEEKILDRIASKQEKINQETVNLGPDPKHDLYLARARELGIPVNKKWSTYKLQSLVQQAEDELDRLPPEQDEFDNDEAPAQEAADQDEYSHIADPEELKDVLLKKAQSLGIPATKLWGTPRLRQHIKEAESK